MGESLKVQGDAPDAGPGRNCQRAAARHFGCLWCGEVSELFLNVVLNVVTLPLMAHESIG